MAWPEVTPDHHDAVNRVMSRGIFADGPESRALEREAAAELGWAHAVLISNGTTALMAVLAAMGIGPTSIVAAPALSFSGTVYGAQALGAGIDFCDIGDQYVVDQWYGGRLDCGSPAGAYIPVHLHGRVCTAPAPWPELVIDDSCQAPRARTPGSLAAAVSLNHSKTPWGGEGGLVLTDDGALAHDIHQRRCFGEGVGTPRAYVSGQLVAGNWRATELTAALARASVRHLERWEAQSMSAALILADAVDATPILDGPDLDGYLGVHKYRVMVDDPDDRDRVMKDLDAAGVPTCTWQTMALPRMPAFSGHDGLGGPCPNTDDILARSFIIGTERRPLCITDDATATHWGDAIVQACR